MTDERLFLSSQLARDSWRLELEGRTWPGIRLPSWSLNVRSNLLRYLPFRLTTCLLVFRSCGPSFRVPTGLTSRLPNVYTWQLACLLSACMYLTVFLPFNLSPACCLSACLLTRLLVCLPTRFSVCLDGHLPCGESLGGGGVVPLLMASDASSLAL